MIGASAFDNKLIESEMQTSYINKVPVASTVKLNPTLSWAKKRSLEVIEGIQNLKSIQRRFRRLRKFGNLGITISEQCLDVDNGNEFLSSSCPSIAPESQDNKDESNGSVLNCDLQNHSMMDSNLVKLRTKMVSASSEIRPKFINTVQPVETIKNLNEAEDSNNLVKIQINDVTPSGSQEFIYLLNGQRLSPTLHSSPNSTSSLSSSNSTNIGGTTAKKCAKRNSNTSSIVIQQQQQQQQQKQQKQQQQSYQPSEPFIDVATKNIVRRKSWCSVLNDKSNIDDGLISRSINNSNKKEKSVKIKRRSVSLSRLEAEKVASLLGHLKDPRSVSKMTKANGHERSKINKLNYNQNDLREDDEVVAGDLKNEKNEADDVDIKFNSPTPVNCNQFDKPRSLSAGLSDNYFASYLKTSQKMNTSNALCNVNSNNNIDMTNTSLPISENSSSREFIFAQSNCNGHYLTPRNVLHKSVSTPLIFVAQEALEEVSTRKDNKNNIRRMKNSLGFVNVGVEDVEDDDSVEELPNFHLSQSHISLSELLRSETHSYIGNQESDDEKSLSKRKKRGSLFFRKKRAKEKEMKKSAHQFVTVCFSTAALCDVCKKGLANKPAIKCENCLITVHDNSCKDQILDCNKFRLAKKPSHLALNTKERTLSPMLQVPPGRLHYCPLRYRHLNETSLMTSPLISNALSIKTYSPNSSQKDKKLSSANFTKAHQSSPLPLNSSEPMKTITKPSTTSSRKFYTPRGYSQWARVATKLGVHNALYQDKETFDDANSNIIDTNSASMESLDEGTQEIIDFDDDPLYPLLDEEPEAWSNIMDKKILKKLKEKDIKRQEAIHELIITEKHHCLTLKIMQKIFAEGMINELNLSKDMVERIFPCLDGLLEIHLNFFRKLKERQLQNTLVENIGDIVLQQFLNTNAEQMRLYYGQFCSQHKEALSLYKDIIKTDRKFQTFIKKCVSKPLCKARGIPECILLVTQRITKYPLLIDSLLKVTKENKADYSDLKDSLVQIKQIINKVDAQVAVKEKEIRLLEIYNKIDAKSTAIYKNKKFKKSDLLSNNRKLRHESLLSWKSARGKVVDVIGVILSDVVIFLQETNQKYHFISLDNKSGVINLQKLLVREIAGQFSKGVYLISSNPYEPEMYELLFATAKDQKIWIDQIRYAVENCPDEDEGVSNDCEEKKVEEARKAKIRELLNAMYEKDAVMAKICEDKMKVFAEMMELLGIEQEAIEMISYQPILEDNYSPKTILNAANEALKIVHNLYVSGCNLNRSVSSAGEHQSETFVYPILPKRAETFGGFDNPERDPNIFFKKKLDQLKGSNPNDVNTEYKQETNENSNLNDSLCQVRGLEIRRSNGHSCNKGEQRRTLTVTPTSSVQSYSTLPTFPSLLSSSQNTSILPNSSSSSTSSILSSLPLYDSSDIYRLTTTPLIMTQGKEQLIQIAELQNQVNILMCLFNYQQTLFENMRIQLIDANNKLMIVPKDVSTNPTNSNLKSERRSFYKPEHQLEELRNLQEQLSLEKSQWQKTLSLENQKLDEERKSLMRLREQVNQEQKDVDEQRQLLYRKLEALQKEGILLSPAHTVVNIGSVNKMFIAESLSPSADCEGSLSSWNDSKVCSANKVMPGGSGNYRSSFSNISNKDTSLTLDPSMIHPSTSKLINRRHTSNNVINVRQQLPLKLALNDSSPTTNITTSSALSSSGHPSFNPYISLQSNLTSSTVCDGQSENSDNSAHQMLPLKLASESKLAYSAGSPVSTGLRNKAQGSQSIVMTTNRSNSPLFRHSNLTQSPRNIHSPDYSEYVSNHQRTRSNSAQVSTSKEPEPNQLSNLNTNPREKTDNLINNSNHQEIFC